jgi:hypothetical protein
LILLEASATGDANSPVDPLFNPAGAEPHLGRATHLKSIPARLAFSPFRSCSLTPVLKSLVMTVEEAFAHREKPSAFQRDAYPTHDFSNRNTPELEIVLTH